MKPLLAATGCYLTITDALEELSARLHIQATATLTNGAGATVATTAFATIDYEKKGMDAAQCVGAASSYARKYALNGLFAIDDTKDADATNTHGKDGKGKAAAAAAPAAPAAAAAAAADDSDVIDGVPFIAIEAAIMCCNSTKELSALYNKFNDEHAAWLSNERIMAVFTRRKHELNGTKKG